MARNAATVDYRKDYYRGFAKIYFNGILDSLIEFGDLRRESGLILDYGCGVNHLKNRIAHAQIVGYDIIAELSDIADYRLVRPVKIVLSSVLEHLHVCEIENLLNDFLRMNCEAELLVALPTENIVSKIAMHVARQPHAHDDHVSGYREINNVVERHYYPLRRTYLFFGMAQITRYIPMALTVRERETQHGK